MEQSPADLTSTLQTCCAHIQAVDRKLDHYARAFQAVLDRTAQLEQAANPTPAASAAPENPAVGVHRPTAPLHLPVPPRFDGTPEGCRGFLNQIKVHFEFNPSAFVSEKAKVGFILSLLTGKALAWASPLWESDDPVCYSAEQFLSRIKLVFDVPGRKANAARSLMTLRQGNRSLADFTIEFRTIATELRWNDEALAAAYYNALSERLKDELWARDLPEKFEEIVLLASRVDARMRDRVRTHMPPRQARPRSIAQTSPPRAPSEEEPMQLGFTRLSEREKTDRRRKGLCLYCGGPGHYCAQCPRKPGNYKA